MGDVVSVLEGPERALPDEVVTFITAGAVARKKRRRRRRKGKAAKTTTYKTREQIVRDAARALTRSPRDWCNVRPKWLVGEHGKPLECDLYSQRHACVIHCDGEYHERRLFWQTPEEWEQTRRNDVLKRRLLERYGFLNLTIGPRRTVGDHALPHHVAQLFAQHRVLARKPVQLPV